MQDLETLILEKNINGILVDIDDTLYDYKYAHSISLQLCFKDLLNHKEDLSFNSFKKDYRASRDIVTKKFKNQGSARSRLLAFQILFEKYDIKCTYSHALDYEVKYWKYLIKNIKPNLKLIKFLKQSRSREIKICAVSDMQMRYQIKKLKKLNLESTIQYLVTSEEYGFEKPEKGIYDHALKKISSAPHRTVMIGDNIKKDIEGAKAHGIHTYLEKYTYKK
jgi:putative hydrolase of the HAD superfamily